MANRGVRRTLLEARPWKAAESAGAGVEQKEQQEQNVHAIISSRPRTGSFCCCSARKAQSNPGGVYKERRKAKFTRNRSPAFASSVRLLHSSCLARSRPPGALPPASSVKPLA